MLEPCRYPTSHVRTSLLPRQRLVSSATHCGGEGARRADEGDVAAFVRSPSPAADAATSPQDDPKSAVGNRTWREVKQMEVRLTVVGNDKVPTDRLAVRTAGGNRPTGANARTPSETNLQIRTLCGCVTCANGRIVLAEAVPNPPSIAAESVPGTVESWPAGSWIPASIRGLPQWNCSLAVSGRWRSPPGPASKRRVWPPSR